MSTRTAGTIHYLLLHFSHRPTPTLYTPIVTRTAESDSTTFAAFQTDLLSQVTGTNLAAGPGEQTTFAERFQALADRVKMHHVGAENSDVIVETFEDTVSFMCYYRVVKTRGGAVAGAALEEELARYIQDISMAEQKRS